MEYVILDLEWNGTYSCRRKGFINEIIEFGAVKVDEELNIVSTFSHLVRPQIGKKISGKIKNLTNLTNEQLSHGMHFLQVASRFRKWMGDAVLLTWGISDILTLIENFQYFCGSSKIPFLKQYINLQSYCAGVLCQDDNKLMGLSNLAERLGIDQDDIEHHRALDDSLLSLRCFRRLYEPKRLRPYLQVADQDFYDKITFKTTILCDLSNPLIQRKDMLFNCDCCGRPAHRESDWILKNKSYRANFFCRSCKNRFYGRVQFKLKYDGLVVRKSIFPYEEITAPPKEERREKREKKEVNVVRVNKLNKG